MQPVQDKNRFESLDVLRGLAVLGILAVNVQAFSMHYSAYEYPLAHMDLTGANLWTWIIQNTFFEMKFITIFSALFGAGIVLMVGDDRQEKRRLHFSRMRWLLLIGLIHAYVFWFGDILTSYAIVGMIAVFFVRMSVTKLMIWGSIWITISGMLIFLMTAAMAIVPEGMVESEAALFGAIEGEALENFVARYQAGFLDRLGDNALTAFIAQLTSLTLFGGRLIGVMFIGMALFKSGFLTLKWSASAYTRTALMSGSIGLALCAGSSWVSIDNNFSADSYWISTMLVYVGSLVLALSYASVIMLICQSGALGFVRGLLANTGRMAFTNYLTQTLIMTLIFVGTPGLGLFGQVERTEQFMIVIGVWALQLAWSSVWLKHFRYGPLEWLWRGLSYGEYPKLKREPTIVST